MSAESTQKGWVYAAIAGAGLLVGVAIYGLLLTKEDSSSSLIDEVDALGPPKKGNNGMLEFNYYKKVFSII